MFISDYKKDLLIIRERPSLMAEMSRLDSNEGISTIVWNMAIFDFNKQNITMAKMDYSSAALHILALCKFHSDEIGLEGHWHIDTGFSYYCMSELVIEDENLTIARLHSLIDNPNCIGTMMLNFHAMGAFINTL